MNGVQWRKLHIIDEKENQFIARMEWITFLTGALDIAASVGGNNIAFYRLTNRSVIYCVGAPNNSFSRYEIDTQHVDGWEIEQAQKMKFEEVINLAFPDQQTGDV